jgi:hypothetical protein
VCDWRESAGRLAAGAWVSVDLDVLRSERERELTLFVARARGEITRRAERSSVRKAPCGNRLAGGDREPE